MHLLTHCRSYITLVEDYGTSLMDCYIIYNRHYRVILVVWGPLRRGKALQVDLNILSRNVSIKKNCKNTCGDVSISKEIDT